MQSYSAKENSSYIWESAILLLIICVGVGVFWWWPQYQKQLHDQRVSAAIIELQKSHFETATGILMQEVLEEPNDLTARMGLANGLFSQGKLDDALKLYQSFDNSKANDYSTQSLLNISAIYEVRGEIAKALAALKNLETLEPSSAFVSYRIGSIYLAQKTKEAAEKYFRRTLDLEPTHELALLQMGRLQKQKEELPIQSPIATSQQPVVKSVSKALAKAPVRTTSKKRTPATVSKIIKMKTITKVTKTKRKKK